MEEYRIVSSNDKDELVERVNEWLGLGWRLQGGVSVMSYPTIAGGIHQKERFGFFQAIVKNK